MYEMAIHVDRQCLLPNISQVKSISQNLQVDCKSDASTHEHTDTSNRF